MSAAPRQLVGYTLFLLFLVNLLNFFDRAIPAVVLEPIRQEFGLDDTALGILNTAFTLIYALAGVPLGRLSDRYLRTRILSLGVLVWSALTAASGAAWNFMSLLLARVGVGIGEASCAPAANAMIGDLYPAQRRARALGIFMLGLPVGNLLCYALVAWIAQLYGWRMAFFLAAIPGVLVAWLIWRLPEPQRGAQEAVAIDLSQPVTQPYRRILRVPTVWGIIFAGAAYNFAAYAFATFLPAMLQRAHAMPLAQAGTISAIVFGLTGLIGLTAGGVLADRMHQRHPRGRLLLGAICVLAASPLLWFGLTRPAGGTIALTLGCAGGWMLGYVYYVTAYASLQDVVEPRLRATAMALFFFFQYVLGGGLGTTITGALSDRFAAQAMAAAGAETMEPAFRAAGLQQALAMAVPLSVLVTGLALLAASRFFVRDVRRAR